MVYPARMEQDIRDGRRILAEALRSKVPWERRIAQHINTIFENTREIIMLERKLGISPSKRYLGLFLRSTDNILAIIGKNKRLLRRGEKTIATGDFWNFVKKLKRISVARKAELNNLRRQLKRKTKITAQQALQKRRRR